MVIMKEETTAYQAALDYLYSFVDYSLTRNFRNAPEKFDLGRMFAFLNLLGNPHQRYPVIHVAGTKGKGSTARLMASVLQEAGYQTGLYTSPHLQEYTERIQVNSDPIDMGTLAELVEYLKPYVEQVERLTTFEITTAAAFVYFARQQVDVAVIEVGLGGRLDATNVVTPLVSVITSLSMDHMNVLGDTLGKIALEKAGIIKPGRPVVSSVQQAEAQKVVEMAAAERGSPLAAVGQDFLYTPTSHSLAGQDFQVWKAGGQPEMLHIPLLGLHQVENAATAYAALCVAREQGLDRINNAAIRTGFAKALWPGRFEILHLDPPVIVDSAHNRDSARRLAETLEDYLPGRPVTLIFGASDDKDVEGIFAELLPRASRVIATQSIHPRAMEASRLAALAGHHQIPAEAVVPIEHAVDLALQRAGRSGVVLATGSIFIAAAVREIWRKLVESGRVIQQL